MIDEELDEPLPAKNVHPWKKRDTYLREMWGESSQTLYIQKYDYQISFLALPYITWRQLIIHHQSLIVSIPYEWKSAQISIKNDKW